MTSRAFLSYQHAPSWFLFLRYDAQNWAEGKERIEHKKIGVEGVRLKTEPKNEMVERGSRGNGQGIACEGVITWWERAP